MSACLEQVMFLFSSSVAPESFSYRYADMPFALLLDPPPYWTRQVSSGSRLHVYHNPRWQAYMEAMAEMEDRLKCEHATAGTRAPHVLVVVFVQLEQFDERVLR